MEVSISFQIKFEVLPQASPNPCIIWTTLTIKVNIMYYLTCRCNILRLQSKKYVLKEETRELKRKSAGLVKGLWRAEKYFPRKGSMGRLCISGGCVFYSGHSVSSHGRVGLHAANNYHTSWEELLLCLLQKVTWKWTVSMQRMHEEWAQAGKFILIARLNTIFSRHPTDTQRRSCQMTSAHPW